jgi:hypothetical protein
MDVSENFPGVGAQYIVFFGINIDTVLCGDGRYVEQIYISGEIA